MWLVLATTHANLEDLTPIDNSTNSELLNWSTLLKERHPARNARHPPSAGTRLRALGYMTDTGGAVPEGKWIQEFVLLPDAGNALHPAHRFGDQMIGVHLKGDLYVQFCARSLVWVSGVFRELPGDPAGSVPLYSLEDGTVQAADPNEISRYFR